MLAVENLTFRYPKSSDELFSGLTHHFATGKVTAITGPSGRGKSTLLYILGLLLTPEKGAVFLQDRNVSAAADSERAVVRASQIGFVFQDASLDLTRTVLDSVVEPALYAGWRRRRARHRAIRLLYEIGVGHRASHKPGQISGGQAQRVAVCRSLVTDPSVILADEPTGNLDQSNAESVLNVLSDAAGSGDSLRTVVVATHDPFVIDFADEVISL
ncbi:ABC transporter ATP-binding protein [Nesterenkonia alba]|uniref:ABC transporter ATP-binding protein n=1 Tax=Nesterenkonia alba TaxID=515814 RepID=UPI00052670D9|nr:ATP-binding cassette domain-containing protein [Nesterenkonia alba]